MHRQRPTNALPQDHKGFALHLRGSVQPVESGLNILIDRRQTRLALRLAIASIIQHQHLIALLWQPPDATKMPGQVATVAVQMQHRALHRHAFLGGQPPAMQARTVGSGEVHVLILQARLVGCERNTCLGVEQHRTATGEREDQGENAEQFQMRFPFCFHRKINAEPTRSNGTIVTRLSFLTLQRGNAVLDALRPILTVQRGADL